MNRFSKIKNFLNKITVKQIIMIILFGILISVASAIIGYIEFSRTIEGMYNKQAEEITTFIKQNVDLTEYEAAIGSISNNFYETDNPEFERISQQPGYQDLVKEMSYLLNSFDGLDVFIGNYNPAYAETVQKTLEDSDDPLDIETKQSLNEGDQVVVSYYRSPDLRPSNRKGDTPGGYFLVSGKEKVSLLKLYDEKTTQFLETEIVLGDDSQEPFTLFSVYEPLINSSGDMIGFTNVSIKITVIQNLLARYLFLVGLLTILLGIIFIFIYIQVNRRMFLKPILSIIQATSNFVKNNNQVTESLTEIKTGDEIQTLAESILKLENDINAYIKNLAEVTAERERVRAELDLATTIQMSMLPQEIPEITQRDEFEIAALMNPAREVGGDFYNYFMIDNDHLGFVVGDVSGKGVPAALFMMIGTILIKTQSLPNEAVNNIIEKVNNILSENNAEMLFITSWMGIYEISTGKVTFINAGHEPPFLIHENGEYEFIKTKPNLALATFAGIPYRLHEMKLKKGDKIFLYTDGVVEAQNNEQEFYESNRLINIVKSTYKNNIKEVVRTIREDIDVFVDGAEQFDDITIVGLEVKKDPNDEDIIDIEIVDIDESGID